MQLLQDIAAAYQALTQFECRRAIELFSLLPARHYNTGWVLCHVARAYFELCDYRQVQSLFYLLIGLGDREGIHTHTHTTVLQPFFPDNPGEPVSEEDFWTLRCKGRLTEANTLTIRLGATPSGLTDVII